MSQPRAISLLFVVASISSLALPSTALAYDLRHDSDGDLVRWAGHVEFVLDSRADIQLDARGVEAAVSAAVKSIGNATTAVTVGVHSGQTLGIGYSMSGQNQNDIIVLADWPYQDGALAATLITLNKATNRIIDADIVFNAEQHRFLVLSDDPALRQQGDERGCDDVQNTLTHELGHAMGLLHNAEDEKVVMYPGAQVGEIIKRTLADDDRAGLTELYGAAPEPTPVTPFQPAPGCSATGGTLWLSLLALGALLLKRRAVVLVALPAVVLAGEPAQRLDLSKTERVSVGQVVSAKTVRSAQQPGLLFTDLTISVKSCVRGTCPATVEVRVPGGTLGDLEQVVVDHPVPVRGETLAVAHAAGRVRLHRLAEPAVRAAFDAAVQQLKGSVTPQSTSSDQPKVSQSPATSR